MKVVVFVAPSASTVHSQIKVLYIQAPHLLPVETRFLLMSFAKVYPAFD
jgi:hypothetical protein